MDATRNQGAYIKQKIMNVLHFLRLTDPHDGLISLSNLAVIIIVSKIAVSRNTPTAQDLGALFLALANYNAKKLLAPEKTCSAVAGQITEGPIPGGI